MTQQNEAAAGTAKDGLGANPPDQPPRFKLLGNFADLMREPSQNTDSVPMVAGARNHLDLQLGKLLAATLHDTFA